jgi:uncharacterized protein (DUF952 family)
MIYHVITNEAYAIACGQGWYEADSLATEGFIHLSQVQQVRGVLERYYSHQADLLVMEIDEQQLAAPLKYELAPSVQEMFPHLYGRLNMGAVVKVIDANTFR